LTGFDCLSFIISCHVLRGEYLSFIIPGDGSIISSSLFSVDFFRQDNRWKQRRVRSRVLLGNSRYTVTYVEAQALTHFRAVTLAVTLRYILGFVTPVRRNINDKALLRGNDEGFGEPSTSSVESLNRAAEC
jgi:hypothetical protein